ncbi:oxygenase MpaB family protein [Streptomyces sp. NPDC052225]|uniref:oxygenase MpaB family protein n=1 Tax=Streptomyces sp. NPDC052225 TaxID=3154949 RepID=UPI0034200D83
MKQHDPDPPPPPPGGILWDTAGDIRSLLALPAAFVLQVAHPAVGAGVDDHSVFRTDPWGRGRRSLTSVLLWVYGGEAAAEEGRRLRRVHRDIRGTDPDGRHYHALTPAYYAWVHATGYPVARYARRYFARPFTPEEDERFYAEWLMVGRILGIHDRDMPQTTAEFWPYYRETLARQIGRNPVVDELTSAARAIPAPPGHGVLRLLWPVLRPALARTLRFLSIGLLPPEAREALDLRWTARQERALRRLAVPVRWVVPRLPERLRYLPLARRARAGGGCSRSSPRP